jgi:hypothetical protein
MSTTLVPPTWYVIRPRSQTLRVFPTIAEVATALVMLGPTSATVSAITGTRTRSLTETELHELRQRVRAHRLHADEAHARRNEQPLSPRPIASRDHPSRRDISDAGRKGGDNVPAVNH